MHRTEPSNGIRQLSEAEFLDLQAQQAREAVARTLEELKESLKTASDIKLWAQHHPWLTVGTAAATGFAAGSAVTSMFQHQPETADGADRRYEAFSQQRASPPAWTSLLAPLFDVAKVAVQSAIAAGIGAMQQQQPSPEAQQAAGGVPPHGEYADAAADPESAVYG